MFRLSGWWDAIIVRQRKQPTFGCTQLPPGYWSNPFKEFWHLVLYNARIVCCSRDSEELHPDQLSQQWRLTSKNNVYNGCERVDSSFRLFKFIFPRIFYSFYSHPDQSLLRDFSLTVSVWVNSKVRWRQDPMLFYIQEYSPAISGLPILSEGWETDDNSSTLCWSGRANMVGPTSKPSATTRILVVSKFETVVGRGTSRFSSIISGGYANLNVSSPLKPTCLRQRSGAYIHSHACQSQLASGIECVAEWLKPATMEAEISQWQRDQQVRFEEEWLEAWPFCLLFVVLVLVRVVVVVVVVVVASSQAEPRRCGGLLPEMAVPAK